MNFPPNAFDTEECIRLARNDALQVGDDWHNVFGGSVAFDIKNSGSYWTSAGHFTTFYKNNISRKSKFHSMKEESMSTNARGEDSRLSDKILYVLSLLPAYSRLTYNFYSPILFLCARFGSEH